MQKLYGRVQEQSDFCMESAGRALLARGKQEVSRHLCRWNLSVYTSVSQLEIPLGALPQMDFELGA